MCLIGSVVNDCGLHLINPAPNTELLADFLPRFLINPCANHQHTDPKRRCPATDPHIEAETALLIAHPKDVRLKHPTAICQICSPATKFSFQGLPRVTPQMDRTERRPALAYFQDMARGCEPKNKLWSDDWWETVGHKTVAEGWEVNREKEFSGCLVFDIGAPPYVAPPVHNAGEGPSGSQYMMMQQTPSQQFGAGPGGPNSRMIIQGPPQLFEAGSSGSASVLMDQGPPQPFEAGSNGSSSMMVGQGPAQLFTAESNGPDSMMVDQGPLEMFGARPSGSDSTLIVAEGPSEMFGAGSNGLDSMMVGQGPSQPFGAGPSGPDSIMSG